MVGRFVEMCKSRRLKFNAAKSKVMILGGEEGVKCELCVVEMRLEQLITGPSGQPILIPFNCK